MNKVGNIENEQSDECRMIQKENSDLERQNSKTGLIQHNKIDSEQKIRSKISISNSEPPKHLISKFDMDGMNIFETFTMQIQTLLRMLPPILGIINEATDYYYYASQRFAHPSIKQAFLFYILFTPFLLSLVWNIYFCIFAHNERDKSSYEKRQRKYFSYLVEKKQLIDKGEKFSKNLLTLQFQSISYFLWIQMVEGLNFIILMVSFSFQALIYGMLQKCKILPYYIAFFDNTLQQVRYPITKELVDEFKAKETLLNNVKEIQKQNTRIDQINEDIRKYNEEKSYSRPEKPIKQKFEIPSIYATDPLRSAAILKNDKTIHNQLLHDPNIENFLLVGAMIEAAFESNQFFHHKGLPMLTLQYINNGQLDLWLNIFNIISFIFSLLTVTINCCKMTYAVSENETFPLMKLKNFIKNRTDDGSQDRIIDPIWLLQANQDQIFHIFDMESMKKIAGANSMFFQTIKGIQLDIIANPKFLEECLEGNLYPFQCLSNIMKNMNEGNDLRLLLSDNSAITKDHLEMLFNSLAGTSINSLEVELEYCDLENLSFLQGFKYIGILNSINIDLRQNIIEDISDLDTLKHLSQVRSLTLNLKKNSIVEVKALEYLKFMTSLTYLNLDLGSNKIGEVSCLNSLSQLVNLKNLSLYLNDNRINDVTFLANFKTLTQLITLKLNFDTNERFIGDVCMDFIESLTLLEDFQIFFKDSQIEHIASFKYLQKLVKIQILNISLINIELEDISIFQNIMFLSQIAVLQLDFYFNKISNIDFISHFTQLRELKEVDLNFGQNYVVDLQPLKSLQNSPRITSLKINLQKNQITEVTCFDFTKWTSLESLDLDLQCNKIEDMNFLSTLDSLVHIKYLKLLMGKNQFKDLSLLNNIGKFKKLESLIIDLWCNNCIDDISFVSNLINPQLQYLKLYFTGNNLRDISSLKQIGELKKLKHLLLEFSANQIDDLSILNNLGELILLEDLILGFSQNFFHHQSNLPSVDLFGKLVKLGKLQLDFRVDQRSTQIKGLSDYLDGSLQYFKTLNCLHIQIGGNVLDDKLFLNKVLLMTHRPFEIYLSFDIGGETLEFRNLYKLNDFVLGKQ